MNHTKKTINLSEKWASELAEKLGHAVAETTHPGEGWVSAVEYARHIGVTRRHALQSLCDLVREGRLQVKQVRIKGHLTQFFHAV